MNVLEVKKLFKTYKKRGGGEFTALDGISFSVAKGEIVGLLGPNGAGKTTAMKIITGLAEATEGQVIIEGFDTQKKRADALENVGAIVEGPDAYSDWSGLENLVYYASLHRKNGKNRHSDLNEKTDTLARCEDALKLVGLFGRRKDPVYKYSLGMKQRLGLAMSLMNRPHLLVLDEPANGLDPEGMEDMRDTLKNLAKEKGMAILVSSHLLAEMQSLCDRFLIIKNGKIVAEPTKESLTKKQSEEFVLTVSDAEKASEILLEKFEIHASVLSDGKLMFAIQGNSGDVVRELILSGLNVTEISRYEEKLSDVFFHATSRNGEGSNDVG